MLRTIGCLLMLACAEPQEQSQVAQEASPADSLILSMEVHFKNLRQLTFGGENAEAYFSFDDKAIVYQNTNKAEGKECDQIFMAHLKSGAAIEPISISNGKGRCTCAYFLPGDSTVLYASTHLGSESCPPLPDRKKIGKYVWPIYNEYELFVATLDGQIITQLTHNNYYDAEATVSPKGDKIVFTSNRSGDLELYTMNLDGTELLQITDLLGYDGGAFFSPDGQWIVFRASRPESPEEVAEYKQLLAQGLVAPTQMEVFVCAPDGSQLKQVTRLGNANWAPFFHPSGDKIIFSSNHTSERGFPFNLYMIHVDGTGLEQISADDTFDAFPMFSSDGKYLIFSSNRNNGGTRDTNLFLAEWVN